MHKKPSFQIEPTQRSEPSEAMRNMSFKQSEYESKINELSNQVKALREKLFQFEQDKNKLSQFKTFQKSQIEKINLKNRNSELERYVDLLKDENDEMRKENYLLKEKVKNLEGVFKKKSTQNNENKDKVVKEGLIKIKSMNDFHHLQQNIIPKTGRSEIDNFNPNKQSLQISNRTNNSNLIRELLIQCSESVESEPYKKNQRGVLKDQFYEYKNTEDCFEPFYSNLSKQMRLRLKKCLLRKQELLYKDENIEIGTICPYKPSKEDKLNVNMALVVTNISSIKVRNLQIEYNYHNDVVIDKRSIGRQTKGDKYKSIYVGDLICNEQIKEELKVNLNTIDFGCVKITVKYVVVEVEKKNVSFILLLPLSKIKLFREQPFSAMPNNSDQVQKVIEFDRKVLPDLAKLKSYFSQLYESKDYKGKKNYSVKLMFLKKFFWIEFMQLEEKLRICVYHQNDRAVSEKIAQQMSFLLSR